MEINSRLNKLKIKASYRPDLLFDQSVYGRQLGKSKHTQDVHRYPTNGKDSSRNE